YRLSLGRLTRDLEAALRLGEVPDEVRQLRGFNWFIGFAVVDDGEIGRDVLLLGLHDPERSPMEIDCLATAIRVVADGKDAPTCSLDPEKAPDWDPEGDAAYQLPVIRGVPWQSLWAERMIRADYHMKAYSQGLEPGQIIKSYAHRVAGQVKAYF